jgi:hypothetical protein
MNLPREIEDDFNPLPARGDVRRRSIARRFAWEYRLEACAGR